MIRDVLDAIGEMHVALSALCFTRVMFGGHEALTGKIEMARQALAGVLMYAGDMAERIQVILATVSGSNLVGKEYGNPE